MEKRNAYMKKLEENLAEYNAKLVSMKAKVTEVQGDMKDEYLNQIKHLETRRDELAAKYRQLKDSTEQAWDDVKVGTEKTWHELKASVEKVISRFK